MGNIRFNTTTTTTGIFCIYRCRRFLLLLLLLGSVSAGPGEAGEVYLLTAAPRDTDAFQRFLRSARHFNYTVKALGVESEASGPLGGGLALPLVKEALQGDLRHLGDDSVVVVMSRDHDVLLASGPAELLAKFRQARHRLVFAAESFAWPDQGQQGQGLRDHYPAVRHGKRFLSHGGLVGTGAAVRALLALWDGAGDTATDERDFYTRVYLDPELREQLNITLDHRCRIFQNLHGSLAEVVLKFETGRVRARNIEYNSLPVVVFGSGQTKAHLTYLGNYIPDAWSYESGCRACLEEERDLAAGTEDRLLPRVLVALFVETPVPFLPDALQRILTMAYPASRVALLVHCTVKHHQAQVSRFLTDHGAQFESARVLDQTSALSPSEARESAAAVCRDDPGCDFYLSLDAGVALTNRHSLRLLIQQNRKVLAPLVSRTGKLWSNFWGARGEDGFYARSEDYVDIVARHRVGVWSVPHVSTVYLLHGSALRGALGAPLYSQGPGSSQDHELAFSHNLRNRGVFMHLTNRHEFGHLLSLSNQTTTHLHNDLWQMEENPQDWKERYIHADYDKIFEEQSIVQKPCDEVFWFPLFSDAACDQIIEEMENHGEWSGGKHEDKRVGGYESVPTDDIHMGQIGFHDQWLAFLRRFIKPVVEKMYKGYVTESLSVLSFVVRYRPDRQPFLRPHHDASTYTINIALNTVGVDYEGGGCRFPRQECSITDSRKGWALMHPGRLTHLHEGLPTTNGTRYIAVSFVDP
ncbi:procollagen-lysine,2-oxoglutarate 5-dioxygenase 1-like [Petromyzon marinus]|uniref:procollagen-lysine,2-oxoglutarate 5-dioxygenase 1-like n=1 Tax=Petromyzon marinus TaxID=7757 RepID=UPI003F7030C5